MTNTPYSLLEDLLSQTTRDTEQVNETEPNTNDCIPIDKETSAKDSDKKTEDQIADESSRGSTFQSPLARRLWRQPSLSWRATLVNRWPSIEPYIERAETAASMLPPGWTQKLPILLVAFLFSPKLFIIASIITLTALCGYMWGITSSGHGETDITQTPAFRQHLDKEIADPDFPIDPSTGSFSFPPAVSSAMEQLIGHVVRDFVNNWYTNINHSRSPAFPDAVHATLRHAFLKFGASAKHTRPTALVLPVFQAMILHMREYRSFELTALELDQYLIKYPQSPYNRHANRDQIIAHLRMLSMLLAVELLPRGDRSSHIVFEFVHEIIATSVLLPIVEMCSDSDWINRQLIQYLKKREAKKVAKNASKSSGSPGKTMEGINAGYDEIYIKVLEARRLPIADMNELYCSVICGTTVQKSRKVNAESNPMWMQEFRFQWDVRANAGVNGIVIDVVENKLIRDEIIGSVYIEMSELGANKLVKGWRTIDTSESRFEAVTNAEILFEAIRIEATSLTDQPLQNPAQDFDVDDLGSVRHHTTEITAEEILVRSEALVEFMQYMDDIKASHYVQLYVMIDSFNRFAKLEMSNQSSSALSTAMEGLKTDALSIFDTFLSPSSEQFVNLERADLVDTVKRAVLAKPGPDVLRPLQQRVIEVVDKRFLTGFKESKLYHGYLTENGYADSENITCNGRHVKDGSDHSESEQSIASPGPALPPRKDEGPVSPPELPSRSVAEQPAVAEPIAPTLPPRPPSDDGFPTVHAECSSEIDADVFGDVAPSTVTDAVRDWPDPAAESEDEEHAMTRSIQSAAAVLEELEKEGNHNPEAITAAIDTLREQVTVIDSLMRRSTDPDKLSDLASTKLQLQTQVEELADVMAHLEQQEVKKLIVDLSNVRINVLDLGANDDKDKDLNIFNFAGTATNPKHVQYILQIERVDGSGGWMITKSYADIIVLNESLRTAFPKVAKSDFPKRSRVAGSKAREELSQELERWLNIIITDSALCESIILQEFMRPENIQAEMDRAKPAVPTKVLGTLKSAGSLLRKVAVATPIRAATFVASEVNAAVTGVAQGVKRATDLPKNAFRSSTLGRLERIGKDSGTAVENLRIPVRGSSLDDLAAIIDEDANTHTPNLGRTPFDTNVTSSNPRKSPVSSIRSNAPSNTSDQDNISLRSTTPPPVPPRPTSTSPGSFTTASTSNNGSPRKVPEHSALPESELEIIIECLFGTIEEIFALSDPNQWIRQKGLHMVKTILRRTYATTISKLIQTKLSEATSESKMASYVGMLDESLWPEGIWYSTKAQQENTPIVQRTDEEMADTKMEAKHLFIDSGIGGVEAVSRVVGKYNTVAGMTRLFNMLQHRELNRHLMCMILDSVVKGLLGR